MFLNLLYLRERKIENLNIQIFKFHFLSFFTGCIRMEEQSKIFILALETIVIATESPKHVTSK